MKFARVIGKDRVPFERLESSEECGCAPTPTELRALQRKVSRRNALGIGAFGVVALGSLLTPAIPSAFGMEGYPSWDDVQAAKANEDAKAAEITRIEGLIAALVADVAAKQAEATRLGDAYAVAQQEYEDAAYRADDLQAQSDAEAAKAIESARKVGKVAAQAYRNGGDDTSLELFFSGSAATADDLLARLGTMDKVLEANRSVYTEAITARDTAQSLSDQAAVARDERDRLKQVAESKMIAAQNAATEAEAALAAQTEHQATLEAQLAALKDTTAQTVAGYQAGVEAERKAREERERREREEAAARAAAAEAARVAAAAQAAADAAAAAASGGGGGGGGAAVVAAEARPARSSHPDGSARAPVTSVRGSEIEDRSAPTAIAPPVGTAASTSPADAAPRSMRPPRDGSSSRPTAEAGATTSRSTTVAASSRATPTSSRAATTSASANTSLPGR